MPILIKLPVLVHFFLFHCIPWKLFLCFAMLLRRKSIAIFKFVSLLS